MKTCIVFIMGIAGFLCLSGCSVFMSGFGKPDPNMGKVHLGALRQEVESILGEPSGSFVDQNDQKFEIYEFEVNNEPNFYRTRDHLKWNLITLGHYEIIGTIKEMQAGKDFEMGVAYGLDNKVIEIRPVPK
jgi:hypothetical protein